MTFQENQKLIEELADKNGYTIYRNIDGNGPFRFHINDEQIACIWGSASALDWLKNDIKTRAQ